MRVFYGREHFSVLRALLKAGRYPPDRESPMFLRNGRDRTSREVKTISVCLYANEHVYVNNRMRLVRCFCGPWRCFVFAVPTMRLCADAV